MFQHPVPEEHLKSIGDITVSFAALESFIQYLVGSMLDANQRIGQVITIELSFKNLRALLISLYIEKHGKEDEDFKRLRELMTRAGQVEEKRNQITHSTWGYNSDTKTITRMKATAKEKRGFRFQHENISAEDLSKFAAEIRILTGDITQYHFDLSRKGKAFLDLKL